MTSAEALAEIETVANTVAGWFDTDRSGWSTTDHSEVLRALLAVRERVEAAVLHATSDWDRHEAWSAEGALTPAQWLRAKTPLSAVDARQTMRSARLVGRHENFGKALAAGDITSGHVDALARHVTPPRAELFEDHADTLLDGARTLTVDDTAAMARRWGAYADDRLNRGEPEKLYGRRGTWFGDTGDISMGRILGPPEDLATLRAALDRLEPPDPRSTPGGPRTLAQRRYDALMHLANLGLQDGRAGSIPTTPSTSSSTPPPSPAGSTRTVAARLRPSARMVRRPSSRPLRTTHQRRDQPRQRPRHVPATPHTRPPRLDTGTGRRWQLVPRTALAT